MTAADPAPMPVDPQPPTPPLPVAQPQKRRRIDAVDWLRGFAVVLMILAHGSDAWLAPAAKTGDLYGVVRHLSGIPARLFLLLVGVSAAIRFEALMAKGVASAEMRRQVVVRGFQIVGLAYLFRLQEHILAGFHGGWQALFRVDILNAIGSSLIVIALVAVPGVRRPRYVITLVAAALFLALGPFIGPAVFPSWLPRPLTSYIGGQRPMSWFPIFPWAAWALSGVVIGHIWVRTSRDAASEARCFLLTGAIGGLIVVACVLAHDFGLAFKYPNELVAQMGPGSFFMRLGVIGTLAPLAWVMARHAQGRFSPMIQFGQTSLLIYWVHIDLCYGGIARPLRGKLTMGPMLIAVGVLTLAMLGLSVLKTRHGAAIAAWVRARLRRSAGASAC